MEPKEPKLKLVDQLWDRHGRQYVFAHGDARLTISVKVGADPLATPWVVELRGHAPHGEVKTALEAGPTRLEALRTAAKSWEGSSAFDWQAVELLLTGVRGL